MSESTFQYEIMGGSYVRCGSTSKKVPAGFYDVVDMGNAGWGLKPKTPISDDLIDIPGTVADEIFKDVDKFLKSKEQYAAYGLTHKRGYLFFGPPGSGKTSLGMMLAKRFVEQVGGVVMYTGDVRPFYNGVSIMRDCEPGRPTMYLIEECDKIIDNTACLSILDGELSIQGAVFVAMTNYKDKLPPRIANRPGRFDRVTRVDCPPMQVQEEYLRRVEARVGGNPDVPSKIVKALKDLPVSMAHLREAFISHTLMGTTLPQLRKRFAKMAKVASDDSDDDSADEYQWKPEHDED